MIAANRFWSGYQFSPLVLGAICFTLLVCGCDRSTGIEESGSKLSEQSPEIRQWHHVNEFSGPLAQFETVFWEPDDTNSLREWLADCQRLRGSEVLEIGTGTGLVALHTLSLGAKRVVATDINPQACKNARYNAEQLGFSAGLEVRLVDEAQPGPFAVIEPDARFDFIISNPPWESAPVEEVAAYALYDPGFQLLDAMLAEAKAYLKPDGKMLLAYGAKTAILRIKERAPREGWNISIQDSRQLDDLPEVFLPGMLLELSVLQ